MYLYQSLCVYTPLAANNNKPPNIICPSCLVHLAVRGVVLPRAEAKGWRRWQGQRFQRGRPKRKSPFLWSNLGQYHIHICLWGALNLSDQLYHGLPNHIL